MRTFLRTIACAALLAAGVNADAQTISLNGNSDQIWRGTQAGAAAGQWLDLGAVSVGDNRSDLIIGAPGTAAIPGKVYVIFGGPVHTGDISLSTAETIITGGANGDKFGFATAAGNVITPESSLTRNLVVGAPGAFGGKGAVYVYLGGFNTGARLNTTNATFTVIGRAGDQIGSALATADLNNDGFREIIIGGPGNDRIYVIQGGSSLSGTRDLSVTAPSLEVAGIGLGDVLAAGDVTGDNISDLLVGSGDLNIVYFYKGRAAGGIPVTPDGAFGGVNANDRVGSSLRLLDIDHDGIRDIIIGAPGADGPAGDRVDAGSVYMIWGSAALASRSVAASDVTFYGGAAGMRLGTHISAGDVNRDVPSDIVMLGPGAAGGAGELDIYYGRTDRTAYGIAAPNGTRHVDFADANNVDRKILGDPALGAIVFTQVFEVTGEGARDIVASVPGQDGGAGAVYFTISPSLSPSVRDVSIIVNRGGAAASSPFNISNRSIIPITWTATSSQPWLGVSPASGSVTSVAPTSMSAIVNAAGLNAGQYTGTITPRSTSKHLEMLLPITVNLTVTDTLISIDTPAQGAAVTQPFPLSGWAIDRAGTTNTGVDAVHVYAFRNDGSGAAPIFLGAATYGQTRNDVAGAYGAQFAPSGFTLSVAGLAPGPYNLVAYAHNRLTGEFTTTATRGVTVNATGIIAIDTPTESQVVTSAMEVGGWAVDPSAASGPGVDAVQFYIFPNNGADAPVFIGNGSYGWARPDVGSILGSQFTNSGYHFTITGMMPGAYMLGVYAHSTVSNAWSIVKTVHFTVNANSLMSIDVPAAEATVTTPTFDVGGWAIDRSAPSGTGVDQVHVYIEQPGNPAPAKFLGFATLGIARTDVGALYGSRFTNSGYGFNVNRAAAGLAPGVYHVIVWAHSTATNTFNNVAVVRIRLQ